MRSEFRVVLKGGTRPGQGLRQLFELEVAFRDGQRVPKARPEGGPQTRAMKATTFYT